MRHETRIGKLTSLYSPTEPEQIPDPLIANLVELRESEKIISSYRKGITEIEAQLKANLSPRELFELEQLFATDTSNLPEEYIKKIITLCHSILVKLGCKNPEAELISWMNELGKLRGSGFNTANYHAISLNDKVDMYWGFTGFKITEKYKFGVSNWHPNQGFDGLMQALKTEGLLCVSGRAGKAYYKKPPTKGNILGPYQVYHWPPGSEKKPDITSGHVIVICGAERFKTANKTQDTILFIDPTDPSSPDKPRSIYRISFGNFLSTLTDVHGLILKAPQWLGGPFAYCGPTQKMRDDLQQSYLNLIALYVSSIQKSIKQYKDSHIILSFGGRKRIKQLESLLKEQQSDPIKLLPVLSKKINDVTSKRDYPPLHQSTKNGLDSILLKNLRMNNLFFELPPVDGSALAQDKVQAPLPRI